LPVLAELSRRRQLPRGRGGTVVTYAVREFERSDEWDDAEPNA